MSNFFEEINNNNVRTISNGGTDSIHGYSNQCMLISILDYLRYVTKQLHKSTSIADFRRVNNINESNWSQNSEFNYENRSQMATLRDIARKYNLTLQIKYLNQDKSGNQYIGNVAYEIGTGNGSQIVPILAFGDHFQLIIEDENVLSRDIIDTKLSRKYKAHYYNKTTQEYENLDNISNKNDKVYEELEIYNTLIKNLNSQLNNEKEELINRELRRFQISPLLQLNKERYKRLYDIKGLFVSLYNYTRQYNELKEEKISQLIEEIGKLNSRLTEKVQLQRTTKDKQQLEIEINEINIELAKLNSLLTEYMSLDIYTLRQKYLKYKQKYLQLKQKYLQLKNRNKI